MKKVFFANIWPQILTPRGKASFESKGFKIFGNWLKDKINPQEADIIIYPPADFGDKFSIREQFDLKKPVIPYILFPDSTVGWDFKNKKYLNKKNPNFQALFDNSIAPTLSHSNFSLNLARKTYKIGGAKTVYLGIDFKTISSLSRPKGEKVKVIWNHMWRSDKGTYEAFSIIEELASSFPNVSFYVGQSYNWGNNPDVKNYINKCLPLVNQIKQKDNVTFTPRIKSQKKYWSFLKQFDIGFSTSYHEGFGLSMMEQAAAGIACVLPNTEAYPEIHKGAKIVARDRISTTIKELIENPKELDKTKRECLENAKKYDIANWVNNVVEIIKISFKES